jgi:predicted PurR-regulated permease PerM
LRDNILNIIAITGGYTALILAVFLAFGKEWGALVLLLISSISFYHGRDAFMGSISLGLFFLIILRMASYILFPIGFALVIAFIFLPLVSHLEKYRIPRWLSSLVITLGMFFFISSAGLWLAFQLYSQGSQLLSLLEKYYIRPEEFEMILRNYIYNENLIKSLRGIYEGLMMEISEMGKSAILPNVGGFVSGAFELIFSTLIGLVMGFYALKDTKVIAGEIEGLLPERFKPVLEEVYKLLSQYFRGQITVATIVGIFVGFLLQILGIKFGILIGFLAGVMNLIPNFGFATTTILGSIIILLTESSPIFALLKFALVLALDQLLETLVLTPRILGRSVGLHPVLVMVALIVGASLFGAIGVILAVPMAAFLRSLWINRIRGKI